LSGNSVFFKKRRKLGHKSCPYKSLDWHFYERNREKLERNPRIGMAYVTLNKMPETQRKEDLQQAEIYLKNIEEL